MNQVALELYAERDTERVSHRISPWVLGFFEAIGVGNTFCASDLCIFVWEHEACAPDSPGRIMRQLRLDGRLNYEVVNRRQALYRVKEVEE